MKIGYKSIEGNDAIRKLKGFPTEVIRAMIREQVIQGNAENVIIFQCFSLAMHHVADLIGMLHLKGLIFGIEL